MAASSSEGRRLEGLRPAALRELVPWIQRYLHDGPEGPPPLHLLEQQSASSEHDAPTGRQSQGGTPTGQSAVSSQSVRPSQSSSLPLSQISVEGVQPAGSRNCSTLEK